MKTSRNIFSSKQPSTTRAHDPYFKKLYWQNTRNFQDYTPNAKPKAIHLMKLNNRSI